MAAAAVPLMIASMVVSTGAAIYQGMQARETAKFNEKVAKQDAEYQRQLGEAQADRQRRALAKSIGSQQVAAAGAGVSLMSGSILDAFTESEAEGLEDSIFIRAGAENAARGSLIQAENYGRQADSAMVTAGLQVGSTLLSGGSALAQV